MDKLKTMLPKEIHLEQINRFHDKIEFIRKSIDEAEGRGDLKDHILKLYRQYYEMTQIWSKIDDLCEMDIKCFIDSIE